MFFNVYELGISIFISWIGGYFFACYLNYRRINKEVKIRHNATKALIDTSRRGGTGYGDRLT